MGLRRGKVAASGRRMVCYGRVHLSFTHRLTRPPHQGMTHGNRHILTWRLATIMSAAGLGWAAAGRSTVSLLACVGRPRRYDTCLEGLDGEDTADHRLTTPAC